MKICYLANSKGSHEKKWAEFFVKKGHQVCFISIDSKGNLKGVPLNQFVGINIKKGSKNY